MKKLLLTLMIIAEFAIFAETSTINKTVKGYGNNRNLAIVAALKSAVSQVKGLKLNSKTLLTNVSEQNDTSEKSWFSFSDKKKETIATATKGIIKSYDIIEVKKLEDGSYEAELDVSINNYKAPGHSANNRRKVAVLPFKYLKSSFKVLGKNVNARLLSEQFCQNLVSELTQTRRFAILDRDNIDAYAKEKKLILSGDAALEEQAKLGSVLGADYLIVGKIRNLECIQTTRYIDIIGANQTTTTAEFALDYRIITMATRQVKWSDSINLTLNDLVDADFEKYGENLATVLNNKAANRLVSNLIENIYPTMILKIKPRGEMILNQGGRSVSEGDIFEIYSKGEKLIDPYTGESLGSDESLQGVIKIIRVMPKMSIAKIIDGNIGDLRAGDICRRKK